WSREQCVFLAGGFGKPQRFRRGDLRRYRHRLGRCFRYRVEARSSSCEYFRAGHLHDWKRQPRRSQSCASIRGGVAYLIKPFSVASLAEKLRRLRISTVKRNGDPSKRIRLSALGKERSPRI